MKIKMSKNNSVLEKAKEIRDSAINADGTPKSKRFVAAQMRELIALIATDSSYEAQSVVYKGAERLESTKNLSKGLENLAHIFLKHANIKSEQERQDIIDSIELKVSDLDFIYDVTEEGIHVLASNGKYVKMFSEKEMSLAILFDKKKGTNEPVIRIKKWNKVVIAEKLKIKG